MTFKGTRHCPLTLVRYLFACASLVAILAAGAGAQTSYKATDGSTPSGLSPGSPAGSYALSGIDTVNPYNGALSFRLPLLKVGGRGAAGFQITLPIQHKWVVNKSINPGKSASFFAENNWWSQDDMTSPYAAGRLQARRARSEQFDLRCSPGNYLPRETLTRLTFTAPDGTEYELRDQQTDGQPVFPPCDPNLRGFNRGKVFVTADGNSATFISDEDILDPYLWEDDSQPIPSGYLLLKDGTRFRIERTKIMWMRDRNGNLVTFGYDIFDRLTTIKDSLDRQVTIAYANANTNVYYDEISFVGFGGGPRTIRLGKAMLNSALRDDIAAQPAAALFPELSGSGTTAYAVYDYVEMPDHRQYRLRYNRYGELARVELPTGGAVEYDYAAGLTDGYADGLFNVTGAGGTVVKKYIYRRVVERRVYPDGGAGGSYRSKTVYSRPETYTTNSGYVVAEQCTPSGATGQCGTGQSLLSRSYHYYYGSPRDSFSQKATQYGSWKEGKEYRTEVYDPQTGALLRSTEATWQQPAAGTNWPLTQPETDDAARPNSPQVTQTQTRLADANLVGGQRFAYDQYGNRTDVYEYDFGAGALGPLLRRIHSDFVTDAAYVNADARNPAAGAYLRGLLLRQWVSSDAAGANRVSLTTFEYDNYAADSRHAPLLARPSITGLCDAINAQHQCLPSNPAALVNRGNVTGVTSYTDAAAQAGPLTVSTQYDVAGNAVKSIDPRQNESETFYSDSFCNGSACGAPGYTPNTYAFASSVKSPKPDPTGAYASATELTTSTVRDFYTGLAYSTTDANNQTTTFSYVDDQGQPDLLDRLRRATRPDGGWSKYDYGRDQFGDYVTARVLQNDSGAYATMSQYFDGMGRPYRSLTYENQEPAAPWITSDTEYDALGRVGRVSFPYRSSGPGQAAFSGGKWTEVAYDALGRVRAVTTKPDGAVARTDYSGDRALFRDQAGKEVIRRADALGRLKDVWEVTASADATTVPIDAFPGHPEAAQGYRTTYSYDTLGALRTVSQSGQTRSYIYDSLGRLTSATNPESGTVGYTYDPNGNLLTRVDARGVTTTYGYDALNRNTTVRYTDAALGANNHTRDIDRHYDGAQNGRGRFYYSNWDQYNNARFDTHLAVDEYDEVGRPEKYRQHFFTDGSPSPQFLVTRTYDKGGNVKSQTYPSGHSVTYNYDLLGRAGDVGGQAAFSGNLGDGVTRTYADAVSYSEFGGLREERFGTQTPLHHKRHYNSRGQLYDLRLSTYSMQANEWDWNRGAIVLSYDSAYSWGGTPGSNGSGPDNNGNVTLAQTFVPENEQLTAFTAHRQAYSYDSLNRLRSVAEAHFTDYSGQTTPAYTQTYDYDRWGNRTLNLALSPGVPAAQYDFEKGDLQNTNRLYAPGDLAYPDPGDSRRRMRYDAAGNLTQDSYTGNGPRVYDAENRMTAAYDNTGNWASYAYDADGRRVKRNVRNEETWQVYGMDGELLAEYRSGAAPFLPTKEYGYRGGRLLVSIANGDVTRLRRFVTYLYYGALQRDPTPQELQEKVNQLASAGAQSQAQLRATAAQIARGLFTSTSYETSPYRSDAQYVADLYYAYLQRAPDDGGLNWWTGQVAGWGREHACGAFEGSAEFQALVSTLYGGATSDNDRTETFVQRFYLGAYGRAATAAELQQQRDALNAAAAQGWGQVQAQAEAMGRGLFAAQVGDSSLTNQQFVTNLYEGFLQRAPDTGGLNFWAGIAGSHGRQLVLDSFATCGPFRELSGSLWREALWLVSDHLGGPRMVADKTGTLAGVRRRDYLPFGEEIPADGTWRTNGRGYAGVDVRQGFTGYERDFESGLDFAQARYFASAHGRFTSPDPLAASATTGDPQTFNRYSYVRNNPVNSVDPTGMMSEQCSAENSYAMCGGNQGFWGGGNFGDGMAEQNRYYGGLTSNIAGAVKQYEFRANNAFYGGGDGNSVVAYFDIYYTVYDDGTMETDFHLDGGTTGGYNPLWELAQDVNRRPVAKTFAVLYGGSVIAGGTAGAGLYAAGGLGSGLTTLSLGATGAATETATAATVHGAEQLAVRGFTEAEVALTRTGAQFLQRDGASVFLKEITPGRYNVLVQGERGVVTALKNIRWGAVRRLAANYGWYSPL